MAGPLQRGGGRRGRGHRWREARKAVRREESRAAGAEAGGLLEALTGVEAGGLLEALARWMGGGGPRRSGDERLAGAEADSQSRDGGEVVAQFRTARGETGGWRPRG